MVALGKYLILFGITAIVIGLFLWIAGDKLSILGRLPGDIRIDKENFRFYFPITTMVILSVILSVGLYLIRKFLD